MWAKGNLHSHSIVSDGELPPSEVCRYYAEKGYDFLSITDHNAFVDPTTLDSHGLLMIPGIELSLTPEQEPVVPLHVNGLGVRQFRIPDKGKGIVQTLQNCIDAIVASGGIAQINHPNFYYAFDHTIMAQLDGAQLLEIYNGHPLVYNDGDADHMGVEQMWDILLSSGVRILGTAVDDTHHYTEFATERANPERGWVCVRVAELTGDEVLNAIRRGDFYASTGVELEDVANRENGQSIAIKARTGMNYVTEYIGRNGHILQQTDALESSYTFADDAIYVRARVTASDGARAWTQPLFTL